MPDLVTFYIFPTSPGLDTAPVASGCPASLEALWELIGAELELGGHPCRKPKPPEVRRYMSSSRERVDPEMDLLFLAQGCDRNRPCGARELSWCGLGPLEWIPRLRGVPVRPSGF